MDMLGLSLIYKLYRVEDLVGLISLSMVAKNSKLDNLYNDPGCYVVSKAFSISENTTAIDDNKNLRSHGP
jgi:hypothetical protein